MPRLPQELIEAVLDTVEDPESLKLCSLASSQFLLPCQRILFRTVSISTQGRVGRDSNSLSANQVPHLALYIRYVTIRVAEFGGDQRAALLSVLQAVQKIECLVLRGWRYPQTPAISPLIPSLLDILARSSFDRLYLDHLWGIPSAFLADALSSVPVILFQNITMTSTPYSRTTQALATAGDHPRLRHLIILDRIQERMHPVIDLILERGNLQHLERLSLEPDRRFELYPRYVRILTAVSVTLQYLEIDYGPTPSVQELHILCAADRPQEYTWLESRNRSFAAAREDLPHLRRVECRMLFRSYDAKPSAPLEADFSGFVRAMESSMPGIWGMDILSFSRGFITSVPPGTVAGYSNYRTVASFPTAGA
ncbi:hypothetical protein FB451DRAFT_1359012 [Mycena latifolia]|nr:hypothetical protein FB451DRAFT_1359012 [Mycena latifolia]